VKEKTSENNRRSKKLKIKQKKTHSFFISTVHGYRHTKVVNWVVKDYFHYFLNSRTMRP